MRFLYKISQESIRFHTSHALYFVFHVKQCNSAYSKRNLIVTITPCSIKPSFDQTAALGSCLFIR